MDAVPGTDVEPDANVEEAEWHGNIEDPSVGGTSGAAASERGASSVHESLLRVPSESRYSKEGGGEGREGTAASPMEISSSSSDSPGGIFSGEEENTGRESKNSGSDGENSSDTEDAKEEDPVNTVSECVVFEAAGDVNILSNPKSPC